LQDRGILTEKIMHSVILISHCARKTSGKMRNGPGPEGPPYFVRTAFLVSSKNGVTDGTWPLALLASGSKLRGRVQGYATRRVWHTALSAPWGRTHRGRPLHSSPVGSLQKRKKPADSVEPAGFLRIFENGVTDGT
jgi:hypothetical protein